MFPDLTRDDVFRLETRRLWLRWPRHGDVQALVRLVGEKAVAEMTARIPHPYGPDHATAFGQTELGVDGVEMLVDHELRAELGSALLARLGQQDDVALERCLVAVQLQDEHQPGHQVVLVVHGAAAVDVAAVERRAKRRRSSSA